MSSVSAQLIDAAIRALHSIEEDINSSSDELFSNKSETVNLIHQLYSELLQTQSVECTPKAASSACATTQNLEVEDVSEKQLVVSKCSTSFTKEPSQGSSPELNDIHKLVGTADNLKKKTRKTSEMVGNKFENNFQGSLFVFGFWAALVLNELTNEKCFYTISASAQDELVTSCAKLRKFKQIMSLMYGSIVLGQDMFSINGFPKIEVDNFVYNLEVFNDFMLCKNVDMLEYYCSN